MAAPPPVSDSNPNAMAVSPAGAAAVNPDKNKTKRALFKNASPHRNKKESANTPTTGERRATRETYIVAMRGCDPNKKPEQLIQTMLEKIDAEKALNKCLKTSPLELTASGLLKITTEELDELALKTKDLVLMKEGLQDMETMFVVPKVACIGALAAQIAGYYKIYIDLRAEVLNSAAWAKAAEKAPWMKDIMTSVDFDCDPEAFDMTFERSVDRHKDKHKYYADAMALGLASWALPHVLNTLISALGVKYEGDDVVEKGRIEIFKKELGSRLGELGVKGPGLDDGWATYPSDDTVKITAKGIELLRIPPGNKFEMKEMLDTGVLQSAVDVYVAPQMGIMNIKRGFREGGEGLEAVITELGDDVLLVIPRVEMDTEATGLIKLTLRIKLSAEKEIVKKLQSLCNDLRNEKELNKGISTTLSSGQEVRMIWSGDLGSARARNGLNRVAAISAEHNGKTSEEVKKLQIELEKQVKLNADALVQQDTKIVAYTANMNELMAKQSTVVTEMQNQHAEAMSGLAKALQEGEEAHNKQMLESEAKHEAAMDAMRKQVQDMQEVVKQQQSMQLEFSTKAADLTQTLSSFMKAVEHKMLAQDDELRQIKQIKDGYAETWAALQRAYGNLCSQVTDLVNSAHSGRLESTKLDFGVDVAVGAATRLRSKSGKRNAAVGNCTTAVGHSGDRGVMDGGYMSGVRAAGMAAAGMAAAVVVRHASARADRRQAALQRQERERVEQQRFEQLRDREPKVRREPLLLAPHSDISLERSVLWTPTETDSISH